MGNNIIKTKYFLQQTKYIDF